ncbi:hypothetical protein [Sphingobium sp. SCG-1]|uniref:hypothetical protein n=1 Tax=Sphingobium sp. SCG-1 TaxID=2072936 RepID=UPI00166F80E9|nr:hypothetical protein [Sphingobium sp. SCG-1]
MSTLTNGSTSTGSSAITATQARLAIAQAAKEKAAGNSADSATISASGLLAQANQADRAKEFGALAQETRAALDKQYASGKKDAEVNALSGRALASIVLNEGGKFSHEEQAAARSEMKARERDVLTSALSSGMSVATLASYGKTLAENYDAKSPEERRVLGYTPQTRLNAARMASTSSTSLFDQLD